jgi:hypothetical protein
MINHKASMEALKGMETYDLAKIIDEDYYRSMVACKANEVSSKVDALVTELVDVRHGCAVADRFDLVRVCTSKLSQLAMQMKLEDLL